MKMIGIWILALVSSAWKSRPLTPGSFTSRIRQHAPSGRLAAKNSGADAKASTRRPTDRIKLPSAPRTDASSSTTKTTGGDMEGSFLTRSVIEYRARRYEILNRAAHLPTPTNYHHALQRSTGILPDP